MYKIILCVLISLSICYATPPSCLELHQSQLNTINERMNQMISALYSSPILSKLQSATKPDSSPSNTTPAAEVPEPVYDTSAYYPPAIAAALPQVIYVSPRYPQPSIGPPAPTIPVPLAATPHTYYPDAPLEYRYLASPWSQYYEPYSSIVPPSYIPSVPTVPPKSSYPYPEYSYEQPSLSPEYSPSLSYPHLPSYTPPPSLPTPPAFPTPAPTHHKPPPTYATPPPTYSSPPPTYAAPPPTYAAPPPTYHSPPPTYHSPPPTYHTALPTYHHLPPTYHTPPPIYSPSSPSIPYTTSQYSKVAGYSPYYL